VLFKIIFNILIDVSQVLDINGNNFAEAGVTPDIAVNFDWSDLTRNEIIDRAMEEILGF
jgi:C-terminal processing protease CtpA/Prc